MDLLGVVLDSWDRNQAIFANLLQAIPDGGLKARASKTSPSVGQMFSHVHAVRLVFVEEDAPEYAVGVPEEEWREDENREGLRAKLEESARIVRDAVKGRVEAGRAMDLHYDHPIMLLQHMIWHEGYHQGQMKLTLKLSGMTIPDKEAGPLTWRIWMDKNK